MFVARFVVLCSLCFRGDVLINMIVSSTFRRIDLVCSYCCFWTGKLWKWKSHRGFWRLHRLETWLELPSPSQSEPLSPFSRIGKSPSLFFRRLPFRAQTCEEGQPSDSKYAAKLSFDCSNLLTRFKSWKKAVGWWDDRKICRCTVPADRLHTSSQWRALDQ
jgi:hypothetical protein